MTVQRILEAKGSAVTHCGPEDTVVAVAKVLAEKKIGAVVVCENASVKGILSERDIVRAIAAHGAAALDRTASDIMTREVVTCRLHDTNDDVMQVMTGGRFRHLPVVEAGRLAGIISIGDVVKKRIADIEREAAEIRDYIATA